MPNAKGHLLGAISFYVVFTGLFFKGHFDHECFRHFLIGLPFAIFGGLLPDVDIHSEGRKLLWFLILVIVSVAAFRRDHASMFAVGLLFLMIPLLRHRKIFHDPFFLMVWPLAVVFSIKPLWVDLLPKGAMFKHLGRDLYLSFAVGAFSHIALDKIFVAGRLNPAIFGFLERFAILKKHGKTKPSALKVAVKDQKKR